MSSDAITLKAVLEIAKKENPEIKAAKKKWEAARARIFQEATPEKPRVDLERMYAPKDGSIVRDADEKNVAISQEIPFPTNLYWKGRVARREADMAEASYHAKELEVLARVKTAYAMLFLSRHSIHIFEENTDLMRRFSRVAESKYAAGKASQADALKAQVELSKMLNMLVTLEQEKETNQAMLNSLLNRLPQAPLGVPEDPKTQNLEPGLEELQALALKERPELREANGAVEKSGSSVWLARSDYLPDVMLQYRRRNRMSGPDSQDAVVGFSVPLWFWKQGSMVKEAKAEREMAMAEYQATKNMTLFDVKNMLVKVQTAQRLVELYRTSVLPQSQQALTVTEAAYRADRMGFLDLLDAVRSLLGFRLEYYQYMADYERFLAELERSVGVEDLKSFNTSHGGTR